MTYTTLNASKEAVKNAQIWTVFCDNFMIVADDVITTPLRRRFLNLGISAFFRTEKQKQKRLLVVYHCV